MTNITNLVAKLRDVSHNGHVVVSISGDGVAGDANVALWIECGSFASDKISVSSFERDSKISQNILFSFERNLKTSELIELWISQNGKESVVDHLKVSTLAGRIISLDFNGRIQGWATSADGEPVKLEILVNDQSVGTILADGFFAPHSDKMPMFCGFSAAVDIFNVGRTSAIQKLVLASAKTGEILSSCSADEVLVTEGVVGRGGELPIDVVASVPLDYLVNVEAVQRFYAINGAEKFLAIAYGYALEREPDISGMNSFLDRDLKGELRPVDVLLEMFSSDERKERGAFLGATKFEINYPFYTHADSINLPAQVQSFNSKTTDLTLATHLNATCETLKLKRDELQDQCKQLEVTKRNIEMEISRVVRESGVVENRAPMIRFGRFEMIFDNKGIFVRIGRNAKAKSLLDSADAERDRGEFAKAAKSYSEYLREMPRDADIWVQCGNMLKDTSRFSEAELCYRKALELRPGVADTYLQLGRCYKAAGKTTEAVQSYLQAIAADPAAHTAGIELAAFGLNPREL